MHEHHGAHGMPGKRQQRPAGHHAGMEQEFRRRFIVTAILTLPVIFLSQSFQQWLGYTVAFPGEMIVLWVLSSVIVLWGGWPFYVGAVRSLPTWTLDMNVLASVALLTGYLFSTAATFFISAPEFYWEICTLVVFLLFGHWMEMRSVRSASGALTELINLIPPTAHRLVNSHEETVPTRELRVGDVLLVRPGESVPIDGEVIDGESEVNEALVTGEAQPVAKGPGDTAVGGTVNGTGAFRMRVTVVGEETAIARIIAMIEETQASKSRTQRLADRAAHYLTLIALLFGIGALIVWTVVVHADLVFAILRMVTVLIIACPHALGLAIPTVVVISTALGARAGILIRNNEATELAVRLNTIMFDKTGTLTSGTFGIVEIVPGPGSGEDELLRLAATVEANSEHALARGIVSGAQERKLALSPAKDFRAIPGRGTVARIDHELVAVGNRALMDQIGMNTGGLREQVDRHTRQGSTVVYIARDGQFGGIIALADVVRPESLLAVRELQALGLEVAMLTGDHYNVAESVARQLGITTFFAEVQPGEKAAKVRQLQQEGKLVGMVGDGINDAPALVQSDVGIAIGAGTQVAIEAAKVVLVRNDPRDVVSLIRLSRSTVSKMKQNLLWATGYNVIALPLAAGVLAPVGIEIPPQAAALIMAASSIIVVLNALLLRRTHIR